MIYTVMAIMPTLDIVEATAPHIQVQRRESFGFVYILLFQKVAANRR
jgi:hypothetical protein